MKKCELCSSPAKLFCESDQACLCWECDARVHGANFLVTKHSRTLLCHACQSLTPWHASGPRFVPTISLCSHCIANKNENHDDDHEDDDDDDDDDNDDDDDDDVGGGNDEDDEENQVVPWAITPPPAASGSSNSSSSF